MNVLIAKTKSECEQWQDVAVIVDVLRTSTTLCALLERGKKEVLLFDEGEKAAAFAQAHKEFEVFSELDLSVSHQDDSPYLAAKSSARKPALVVADCAAKAALGAREAFCVLVGGFCNFYALSETLQELGKDVLIIPSVLYGSSDDVEDDLCAVALKDFIQGVGNPQDALIEFNNAMRCGEFMNQGPKTAAKDAKIAFKLNGLRVVPQISFSKEGYGVCHLYGAPAPEKWLAEEKPAPAPQEVQPVAEDPQAKPQPAAEPETVPAPEPAVSAEAETADQPETETPAVAAGSVQPEIAEKEVSPEVVPTPEKQEEKTPKPAKRNFFKSLLAAAKEEMRELKQDIGAPVENSAREPEKSFAAPQADDLLDAVLKKAEPVPAKSAQAAVPQPQEAQPKEAPAPVKEEAVVKPADPLQIPQTVQAAVPSAEVTFSGKAPSFEEKKKKKAIVLFSGGLDSTTCLYWALAHGYECEALTISYGQRHDREVLASQMIARNLGVKLHLITLNLPWLSSSALVDKNQPIPDVALEDIPKEGIPSTYVPGRNLMFLSIAGSLLDSVGADAIIAGPNAIDFSGYPDCTPAFFKSAAEALNRGTKMGVTEGVEVLAPLMRLSKTQIVQLAAKLKVPFELTWSCYTGGQKPCGHCDSCKLRAKGFAEAGVRDTSLD